MKGGGMLVTFMDIDPEDEDDFNRWFDREHLAHRVSIPGFLEASRYVAIDAAPKYFSLYWTKSFDVLTSPAYKDALQHQTPWSNKNISRFRGMGRAIAHITAGEGHGRGGVLGVVRIRPAGDAAQLRKAISKDLDPTEHLGVTAMELLESDPALSKSLTDPDASNPGAGDWYVLIEGTSVSSVQGRISAHCSHGGMSVITTGTYSLMWNVSRRDLGLEFAEE